MASVSLRHIYKKYPGGVTAVSDFNLEIKDKEFLVLVGIPRLFFLKLCDILSRITTVSYACKKEISYEYLKQTNATVTFDY